MNRLNKSVHFLGSIFLTFMCVITIPNTSFGQVAKCVKEVEICTNQNGSGACSEKLKLCAEYEDNVLKCTQAITGYNTQYKTWYENVTKWRCGCAWNSPCSGGKKLSNIPDGCCYGKVGTRRWDCPYTVSEKRGAWVRVPVQTCAKWDINVQFGNANIDPNLIEY